jgi:SpoVK/Ycf46/Vps4 family AAA+-type ATPase
MGASGESGQGMHEAHKQVESEFMNWLQNCQEDNVFVKNNIIVVLTTNHKENITGPLLRSGRADLVIDIDNFDAKSMKETFMTAARRMTNRGIKVLGYYTQDELHKAIEKLDLDKLSELCTIKGFTVRDVETLVMEMAAHDYYYKLTGKGLQWNTETFLEVLENSQGSVRDSGTGELVLGDRQILMKQDSDEKEKEESCQKDFDFEPKESTIRDPSKIKALEGMKEL